MAHTPRTDALMADLKANADLCPNGEIPKNEVIVRLLEHSYRLELECQSMTEALAIISGRRQCIDNLMGDKDVAEHALTLYRTD